MNANYARVIPRDLFNESKLLKCIGRLILLIHDNHAINGMTFSHDGSPFDIALSNDGFLYIRNIEFMVGETPIYLQTQYNAKSNFPLYLQVDNYDIPVFDEQGEYTDEFKEAVNKL